MERDYMLPVHLNVMDLDEAWHTATKYCILYGHEWLVKSGSYEGQKRSEFDSFSCFIKEPGKGPLVPMVPEGSGLIPPTSKEYVENYFATYLMSDAKTDKEDYTYGERLVNPKVRAVKRPERKDLALVIDDSYFLMSVNQVKEVIKELVYAEGNSNQTCMEIAMPSDVLLRDPPCLRLLDIRMRYGKLHIFAYFRSWDLWSGFPANLSAIELLKQYMVNELNAGFESAGKKIRVENGSMFVNSKGLHIYEQYYPVVEARWGKKIEELREEGKKNLESVIVYNGIR